MMAALLAAASLAAPAVAQRDRGGEGMQAAPERTVRQDNNGGGQRGQAYRQERREARQDFRQNRQEFRQERRDDRQGFRQERREDRLNFQRERAQDRQDLQAGRVNREQFRQDRANDAAAFRRDRANDRRDFQRDRIEDRRDWQRDRQNWQGNNRPDWQNRDRWQNRGDWRGRDDRWGDRNNGSWNRDWRRDPRYNWQDWRRHNRGSYRFPRYYAPRGWNYGYQRFSFGAFLSAPLFSQNYWIDDPFEYRLPPAYGPYRWIRYYDDALLVDIRTGEVVDVINDFFW
ncbi:MAG: RcnB family protein [Proteobacteria bacterium]|nr:RcnB family protein [Pseudomonadota bacterium]